MTEEDKKEIQSIVQEAMALWELTRRQKGLDAAAKRDAEDPPETKLYLITMTGHQLAFPDETGRAILTQCVYARISRRASDGTYFNGPMEVIAYGEGRRLKESRKLTLTGGALVGMVEVPESIIKE